MKQVTEYAREEFFVFNPRKEKPKKRHHNFEDAKKEAQRLAHKEPGEKYFVLKSMISYKIPLHPMVFKVYKPARPVICKDGYKPIVDLYYKHLRHNCGQRVAASPFNF